MNLFSGKPPTHLAGPDGHLAPCPDTPNCVSSRCPVDDHHFIEPIRLPDAATDPMADLVAAVGAEPKSTIVTASSRYLHAEFRSRIFGFVDDAEFKLADDGHTFDVRSTARLGRSDLGANRARIGRIRARLAATAP